MLDFKVVDIDSQALLGLNTCKELNLVQRIMTVNQNGQEFNSNEQSQADKLVEEYDDVFNGAYCILRKFSHNAKMRNFAKYKFRGGIL